MVAQKKRALSVKCPNQECDSFIKSKASPRTDPNSLLSSRTSPVSRHQSRASSIIRKGAFYRRIDRRFIRRYHCKRCGRGFSTATTSINFRQHRPDLNPVVRELLCSGVSQRRIAKLAQVNLKTVARKLIFLGQHASDRHQQWLQFNLSRFQEIQFDELETFEHTKCKPLSVPLVVEKKSRFILGFDVCSMPAKGLLAKIALKKYGYRKDNRGRTAKELLKNIAPNLSAFPKIHSDENPNYPNWLKASIPRYSHVRFKGKRGCITGQGELKKTGFDPLFDLNHTCAMLRANINRLIRKTWCTTKRPDRLKAHIALYVDYHNNELLK